MVSLSVSHDFMQIDVLLRTKVDSLMKNTYLIIKRFRELRSHAAYLAMALTVAYLTSRNAAQRE